VSPGRDLNIFFQGKNRATYRTVVSRSMHVRSHAPGALINEITVNSADFAAKGELYTLSRTMKA
jgi:hypothetical protein